MGVLSLAERHSRTRLAYAVSAGHRGRGYPGIDKPSFQRFPRLVHRWGVVKR
jgi:hypothetical protein